MTCEQRINHVLERMNTTFATPTAFVEAMNSCIRDLRLLDASCSAALLQAGYRVLDHANESLRYGEPILWIILAALEDFKHPAVLELITTALHSDQVIDKDAYVDTLAGLKDPGATPTLLDILKGVFDPLAAADRVRAKAIHALFYRDSEEVRRVIAGCLGDPDDHVRNEAIKFFWWGDRQEAGPLLVQRLADEDDPYNLELLVKAARFWNQTAALPVLQELVQTSWVQGDEDLLECVTEAIAALGQGA